MVPIFKPPRSRRLVETGAMMETNVSSWVTTRPSHEVYGEAALSAAIGFCAIHVVSVLLLPPSPVQAAIFLIALVLLAVLALLKKAPLLAFALGCASVGEWALISGIGFNGWVAAATLIVRLAFITIFVRLILHNGIRKGGVVLISGIGAHFILMWTWLVASMGSASLAMGVNALVLTLMTCTATLVRGTVLISTGAISLALVKSTQAAMLMGRFSELSDSALPVDAILAAAIFAAYLMITLGVLEVQKAPKRPQTPLSPVPQPDAS